MCLGTLLTSGTSVSYSPTWVTSRVGTRCDYRGRGEGGRGSRQPSAGCTRRSHASRKPPVGFHLAEDKGKSLRCRKSALYPHGYSCNSPVSHTGLLVLTREEHKSWALSPAACCLLCPQAPGGNACVCLGTRASYIPFVGCESGCFGVCKTSCLPLEHFPQKYSCPKVG